MTSLLVNLPENFRRSRRLSDARCFLRQARLEPVTPTDVEHGEMPEPSPKAKHEAPPASDLTKLWRLFEESKYLALLLIFLPLGVCSHLWDWGSAYTFTFNFFAIVPLAWLLGEFTEEIALRTNQTIGGLMNATLGNAVELIISIIALQRGYIRLVQTSLLGSILSNLLLVLGMSFLLGGLKHSTQRYNRDGAKMYSSMLCIACLSLVLPSAFMNLIVPQPSLPKLLLVSRLTASVLICLYGLNMVFQLCSHQHVFENEDEDTDEEMAQFSLKTAIIMLVFVTVSVAATSEFLVDSIDGLTRTWGISESFVGVILLPIVGNAAEHATAVTVAIRNKVDLTIGVAVGSSTQISLFVVPFVVLLGFVIGQPMTLDFSMFETVVLVMSCLLVTMLVKDGTSTWLEGAMLIGAYLIISATFFCLPH